jgi:hypothetical protein
MAPLQTDPPSSTVAGLKFDGVKVKPAGVDPDWHAEIPVFM